MPEGVHILYLEDDPRDVEPVRARLERMDDPFVLSVARDRTEFERLVGEGGIDLILADYMLPAYDGMTAMAYAHAHAPGVPFILISGVLGEEQAVDCVLAGATDYVLKRNLDRLTSAATRALREAEQRRSRRRAERQLEVSNQRYRQVVLTASEGIWVLDAKRRTVLVNAALEVMLGYSGAELLGRRPEDILLRDSDSPAEQIRFLREFGSSPATLELSLRDRDGADVHALVSKSAWFDADARFTGAVLMFTDLTESKRDEVERAALRAQLQRANRLEILGVLAGGVAHDLNNMLAAVVGIASLNLRVHPDDSAVYRDFNAINNAAVRGGEMLARMLRFARGGDATDARDVDINQLLGEVVELLRRSALSRLRIDLDLAESLPPLRGQPDLLSQAMMNLCVNAADAMHGEGALTIRTAARGDRWIDVEIADTGEGMTADVQARVFDPFFTTKAHGTGLGLAIVRNIVENHLGTLELDSAPGEGTRMRLRFPRLTQAAAEHDRAPELATGGKLNVLVIDRDDEFRATTERLVSWLGHDVLAVGSSDEAFARLGESGHPDVVLLDVSPQDSASVEAFHEVSARLPDVTILAMAPRIGPRATVLQEYDPRVRMLPKPFTLEQLRRHIGSVDSP